MFDSGASLSCNWTDRIQLVVATDVDWARIESLSFYVILKTLQLPHKGNSINDKKLKTLNNFFFSNLILSNVISLIS